MLLFRVKVALLCLFIVSFAFIWFVWWTSLSYRRVSVLKMY